MGEGKLEMRNEKLVMESAEANGLRANEPNEPNEPNGANGANGEKTDRF